MRFWFWNISKKFWDAEFVFQLFRLIGLIFIISSDGIIVRQVWIWTGLSSKFFILKSHPSSNPVQIRSMSELSAD